MANPFSIAAGALQVAGAGFKVGTTLLSYADAVRKASTDIRALTTEVSMMATVLQELGLTLQSGQAEKLCRPSALATAKEVIDDCHCSFKEVARAVEEFRGSRGGGVGRALRWPLKRPRMDILQANLERRKSTVLLVMGVSNFVGKAAEELATAEEKAREKDHIEDLMGANHAAAARWTGASCVPGGFMALSAMSESTIPTDEADGAVEKLPLAPPDPPTNCSFCKAYDLTGLLEHCLDVSIHLEPATFLVKGRYPRDQPDTAILSLLTKTGGAAKTASSRISKLRKQNLESLSLVSLPGSPTLSATVSNDPTRHHREAQDLTAEQRVTEAFEAYMASEDPAKDLKMRGREGIAAELRDASQTPALQPASVGASDVSSLWCGEDSVEQRLAPQTVREAVEAAEERHRLERERDEHLERLIMEECQRHIPQSEHAVSPGKSISVGLLLQSRTGRTLRSSSTEESTDENALEEFEFEFFAEAETPPSPVKKRSGVRKSFGEVPGPMYHHTVDTTRGSVEVNGENGAFSSVDELLKAWTTIEV